MCFYQTDNDRYAPTFFALSHVTATAYLAYVVSRGLYQSFKALPPSQDTRHRIHRRRVLAPIFGGLALVALVTDAYYKLGYLTLSYKVWADEHGLASPNRYAQIVDAGLHQGTNTGTQHLQHDHQ
jgi:hypothetical protein